MMIIILHLEQDFKWKFEWKVFNLFIGIIYLFTMESASKIC